MCSYRARGGATYAGTRVGNVLFVVNQLACSRIVATHLAHQVPPPTSPFAETELVAPLGEGTNNLGEMWAIAMVVSLFITWARALREQGRSGPLKLFILSRVRTSFIR